jgi:hypothetical protein
VFTQEFIVATHADLCGEYQPRAERSFAADVSRRLRQPTAPPGAPPTGRTAHPRDLAPRPAHRDSGTRATFRARQPQYQAATVVLTTQQRYRYQPPGVLATIAIVLALVLAVSLGAAIDVSAQANGRVVLGVFAAAIVAAMLSLDTTARPQSWRQATC